MIADLETAQSISGSNIDSEKLTALLGIKFGAGAYNVHVSLSSKADIQPKAQLTTAKLRSCATAFVSSHPGSSQL